MSMYLKKKLPEGVKPGLVKWWKAYVYTKGEVTEQMSPHQLGVVGPGFRDGPKNFAKTFVKKVMEAGPFVAAGVGVVAWAEHEHDQISRSHWS